MRSQGEWVELKKLGVDYIEATYCEGFIYTLSFFMLFMLCTKKLEINGLFWVCYYMFQKLEVYHLTFVPVLRFNNSMKLKNKTIRLQ